MAPQHYRPLIESVLVMVAKQLGGAEVDHDPGGCPGQRAGDQGHRIEQALNRFHHTRCGLPERCSGADPRQHSAHCHAVSDRAQQRGSALHCPSRSGGGVRQRHCRRWLADQLSGAHRRGTAAGDGVDHQHGGPVAWLRRGRLRPTPRSARSTPPPNRVGARCGDRRTAGGSAVAEQR